MDVDQFFEKGKLPSLNVDWLINSDSVEEASEEPQPQPVSTAKGEEPKLFRTNTAAMISVQKHDGHHFDGHVLRKVKSATSPTSTKKQVPEHEKHGFFHNLFGHKKETSHVSQHAHTPVVHAPETDEQKLLQFIDYYKASGFAVSSFKQHAVDKDKVKEQKKNKSHDQTVHNNTMEHHSRAVDAKGRPIPLHPEKSNLPPVLKNVNENASINEIKPSPSPKPVKTDTSPNHSHRFGTFLSKVTSHSTTSNDELVPENKPVVEKKSPVVLNDSTVPGLEKLSPLRHVSFATSTYYDDPPQQICSRNPRQGEVEVKPDGSVIIHRLTAFEKKKLAESYSSGIVVGGSGKLKLLSELPDEPDQSEVTGDTKAPKLTGAAVVEDRSHQKNVEVAQQEATKRAADSSDDDSNDVNVSNQASKLKIDKPMVSRHPNVKLELLDENDNKEFPPPNIKIPLDVVYTRCCHLREILPIPATMKQLKQNSTDPIPLLQLKNPHPSMIEVLSFSDFISVAPIMCLSLDGVHLTVEMLRIILGSLTYKNDFEKLTLRNTPLNEVGWKMVCYFISKSKSLTAIDLTMVPSLKTTIKPPHIDPKTPSSRMKCNMESRNEMNWNLLTVSIASRGGLEEIIISGSQMNLEDFKNFIEVACIGTQRLGLAYNRLSSNQCSLLTKWLVTSQVTGLDIGFNDMKDKLSILSHAITKKIEKQGANNGLSYLSLNGTNLEVHEGDTSGNNEFLKMMTTLCYSENLKFLDISNNPKIFPYCIKTMINCLPVFVNLMRLHLDYENLKSTGIILLCEVVPLCSSLNYLSMMGNNFELAAYQALVEVTKKSNSLITISINFDGMPENLKNELSINSMNNLQNQLKRFNETTNSQGALLSMQEGLAKLLTEADTDKIRHAEAIDDFINKLTSSRQKLSKVIQDLTNIRSKNELTTEGKETLIRLCFIDACFEKGIKLLKDKDTQLNVEKKPNSKASQFGMTHSASSSSFLEKNAGISAPMPSNVSTMSSLLYTRAARSNTPQNAESKTKVEDYNPDYRDDHFKLTESQVSSQIREEGDLFKKSIALNSHLGEKFKEEMSTKNGIDSIEKVDSDQIKNLLLKDDISNVINTIDELHEKGLHLHEIFKKTNDSSLTAQSSSATDTTNESSDTTKVATESTHVATDTIDAAYDKVLDSIQKIGISKNR